MSKTGKHSKRKSEYSKKREINKDESINTKIVSYDKPREKSIKQEESNIEEIQKGKSIIKDNAKRIVVFIICLVIFIFSIINLARWTYFNVKAKKLNDNLINKAFISTNKENSENQENNEISNENKDEKKVLNIDSLKEINPDTVGWICVENTNINYPIVQAKDNEYYLHRDFNKEYSSLGSIFMDWKNNDTYIDRNTVIYGHNIKSGMMFADLKSIYNGSLGKEIYIDIYTSTLNLRYKVYSSYMTDPEDYSINSGIVKADDEQKYINEILKRSTIKYNVVPDKEDKLLTLSTCDSTGKKRILVHASLVSSVENN